MLTTSVERLEDNKVKLTVTVPAEQVDAAVAEAYKRVAAKVKLPGFRPGKAPRPVIDNAVGREYVLAEATEDLVNDTYPRALDAEALRPIESPDMDELENVVPGEAFVYTADVEVRPELTVTSTDVSVTLPPAEVLESEIDEVLADQQDRFATLEPVDGRGVAAKDFVLLSFVGTVDGEEYEGNVVDKYLYELGRGMMPAEFDDGILGVEAGGTARVEFAIPATGSNDEFVGKTAGFDVTVHEIKSKKLPELDDEFASNVGGFDTIEELRDDLRRRIGMQKEMSHGRLKERRVREALAEGLVGEVPESMVTARSGSMMRDFLTMLEDKGLSPEQYMQSTGVTFETIESDIKVQAIQSVREDLALEALVRQVPIEITDEDITAEIASIAEATETTPEETRAKWEEMGLISAVKEQVAHRKAVGWLMDNATVIDEVPEGDAAAEGTKKAAPKKKAAAKKKADPEPEAAETSEE